MTPILMLGAGRMGGALIEGWRAAGAFSPADLIIRDPHPGPAALGAAAQGAQLNPPDADLVKARTVVLAVKPQTWREVADEVSAKLAPDAMIVSIAAGVRAACAANSAGSVDAATACSLAFHSERIVRRSDASSISRLPIARSGPDTAPSSRRTRRSPSAATLARSNRSGR
jgi:predicted dinucleotide-binding enzyme